MGLCAFNRTIVELKLNTFVYARHRARAFNRTIVELKYYLAIPVTGTLQAFNRTIVELKYSRLIICLLRLSLLIVP